jgi:hypothetical protein
MKNIFVSCWFIHQESLCSSTFEIWNSILAEYSLPEQSSALGLEHTLQGYLTNTWINNI